MTEENKTGNSDAPTRAVRLWPLYSLAAVLAAIVGFLSIILLDRLAGPMSQGRVVQTPFVASTEAAGGDDKRSELTNLVRAKSPKPVADFTFTDGEGRERKLSEWKGKIVLLNLWATWCAPCKIEMPGLNRLQAELGGDDFAVLPISLDIGGAEKPRRFLRDNKLDHLGLYLDGSNKLIQHMGAPGLPFTMLIDREGRGIARLAGAAEWDSEDAKAIIRAAIAAGQ